MISDHTKEIINSVLLKQCPLEAVMYQLSVLTEIIQIICMSYTSLRRKELHGIDASESCSKQHAAFNCCLNSLLNSSLINGIKHFHSRQPAFILNL